MPVALVKQQYTLGGAALDTVPQTLSFSKAWEAFERTARVEGRSRKTLAAYRYVLGSF